MEGKLFEILSTEPILSADQREQLSGYGSIMPAAEVFELGWRTAMSYARDALAQAKETNE